MSNAMPILSLQLEGMKHTLRVALQEQAVLMDLEVQKTIEDYCTSGALAQVVRQETMKTLDLAVTEEIRNFFSFTGTGRKAVREAVQAYLEKATLNDTHL